MDVVNGGAIVVAGAVAKYGIDLIKEQFGEKKWFKKHVKGKTLFVCVVGLATLVTFGLSFVPGLSIDFDAIACVKAAAAAIVVHNATKPSGS